MADFFNDLSSSMGKFTRQAQTVLNNDTVNSIGSEVSTTLRRIGAEGINANTVFNLGKAVTPVSRSSNNSGQVEGVDSSYIVTLTAKGLKQSTFGFDNLKISAYMPQNYSMQFGSSWATPLDKSFGEALQSLPGGTGVAGKLAAGAKRLAPFINIGSQVFGTANRHKLQTAHIWQNGQPLSLSIPFHFAANTSTYDDVLRHFRTLSMLASPYEENGILYPPGPTLAGAAIDAASQFMTGKLPDSQTFGGADLTGLGGTIISIQLGEFAVIEPIIIESVDSNIDTINDKDGKPMFIAINVNIKTYYTVSANDISKMLNHPSLRVQAETIRSRTPSQAQSEQPMLYDQNTSKYVTQVRDSAGPYGSGDYNG